MPHATEIALQNREVDSNCIRDRESYSRKRPRFSFHGKELDPIEDVVVFLRCQLVLNGAAVRTESRANHLRAFTNESGSFIWIRPRLSAPNRARDSLNEMHVHHALHLRNLVSSLVNYASVHRSRLDGVFITPHYHNIQSENGTR